MQWQMELLQLCWAQLKPASLPAQSYQGTEMMNYTHQSVNHAENLVDPTTGAYTHKSRLQDTELELMKGGTNK